MSSKRAKRAAKRKREIAKRARRNRYELDEKKCDGGDEPVFGGSTIEYEVAAQEQGSAVGGIGAIHRVVERFGLAKEINERLQVLKRHLPYHESDHVLNIAYNILAGGECFEDLELLRNSEEYRKMLGAPSIPDPTTAGDFCRRFESSDVNDLMNAINEVRLQVWKEQPDSFFEVATIDGDGTLAGTTGECKQGMDLSYKGVWGYHPLVISLANTSEPLLLVNRSGNRPSHEGAAQRFDEAIELCERAGFRKIVLRGDTDFSQTGFLDGWHERGVEFVFGYDAYPNIKRMANELDDAAWKPLQRRPKYTVETKPRTRPENVKEQIVKARGFKNIRLNSEHVAEFEYQPGKCKNTYRLVVLKKNLTIERGEVALFDEERFFFYITNDFESPASRIVFESNDRCNQENLLAQLKSGVKAMNMSSNTLESNWAYMVMASLAWTLKAWFALILPETTPTGLWGEKYRSEKSTVLRMEFKGFLNKFMRIPVKVVKGAKGVILRILSWNPWLQIFNRAVEILEQPLLC